MTHRTYHRGFGYWLTMLLALVVGLIGLWLFIGGIWLISLGGSPFYGIAGLLLLLTSALLFRGDQLAIPVYILAFVFTLIWAIWESGLNGWAQVPRLLGPVILLILVLLANPVLRAIRPLNWTNWRPPQGATATVAIALGLLLAVPAALHDRAAAQDAQITAQTPAPIDTMAKGGGKDWPVYGGSNLETRYSTLAEITPQNAGKLKQVWQYRTGDLPKTQPHPEELKDKYSPETTPIKIGDTLYLCSARDIILAVDAGSGKEAWRYDPQVSNGNIPYGATCRGVAYYAVPNTPAGQPCANRIVEGTMDARLIEVDAATGKLCADFGTGGQVSLLKGIGRTVPGWYGNNAPPMIVRNVIVMGAQVQDGMDEDAPSGVIRGYDVVSGKFLWAWDMGRPGVTTEPGPGETYTRGTPNMWTAAAGDDQLGLVYVPLGNSSVDYFGGNRKPYENTYNSSVVAIDVTSGKEAWHFQTVHYDVWDYDLGSQPTLFDYPGDNGPIPALVLPSKQGQIYVLDRRTGKPLQPVTERPVPKTGSVEPDKLSPTQPYSGYANVDSPDLREADMWGATLMDQLWCRIQFRQANYFGQYTPPSADKPFIEYPSYNGGSDWGSVAVDEKDGILVANYNDMPNFDQLVPRAKADKLGWKAIDDLGGADTKGEEAAVQKGAPYAALINAGWKVPFTGLLCKQPPYGGIRAIDLKTGKTIWDHPLGDARANGPFGLPTYLPITIGTPNNGGPLITAGGLVFIAATTDNVFRAFDIKTGKEVWSTQLPAGGQATPMTFEEDGKQVVAIFAGGHHFMKTPVGDYLMAYALPDDNG
ncbi:MAG TPA: membrane-bound PQQ-dependent dehydrogenase, glucose/quinate/shikimate family [Devosia sp.]|nr:membrane-bound PQQ-dependent dehydrogenase, glucose/quinate/shikimate family [Devosia sp.]